MVRLCLRYVNEDPKDVIYHTKPLLNLLHILAFLPVLSMSFFFVPRRPSTLPILHTDVFFVFLSLGGTFAASSDEEVLRPTLACLRPLCMFSSSLEDKISPTSTPQHFFGTPWPVLMEKCNIYSVSLLVPNMSFITGGTNINSALHYSLVSSQFPKIFTLKLVYSSNVTCTLFSTGNLL